jgi:hypothetical protein
VTCQNKYQKFVKIEMFISKFCKTKNKNCHQLVVEWLLVAITNNPAEMHANPGFYFSNCDISLIEKIKPVLNPSRIKQNERAIKLYIVI